MKPAFHDPEVPEGYAEWCVRSSIEDATKEMSPIQLAALLNEIAADLLNKAMSHDRRQH